MFIRNSIVLKRKIVFVFFQFYVELGLVVLMTLSHVYTENLLLPYLELVVKYTMLCFSLRSLFFYFLLDMGRKHFTRKRLIFWNH